MKKHTNTGPLNRFFVVVESMVDAPFTIEVAKESQAEFISKAVECYMNYNNVLQHMNFAIREIQKVEPPK